MFMIKNFIMKIMQFQFYLLLWCQTAETLTEQLTDLGQNVTINCDLGTEEVYWLLLKLPHPPVIILRTLPSGPFHFSERFNNKYSVQSKSHLFINNVTLDELGVYYCMITDTMRKEFSNGTRLYIIDNPEGQNNTLLMHNEKTEGHTQWLVIMFAVMNGVLVIGLLIVCVHGRKRTSQSSTTTQGDLRQPQVTDLEQSEYSEVNFPQLCKPSHLHSTYALVQLPTSQIYDKN